MAHWLLYRERSGRVPVLGAACSGRASAAHGTPCCPGRKGRPRMTTCRTTRRRFAVAVPLALVAMVSSSRAYGADYNAPGLDTGANAWMLTSAALVLLMTAPGLALFYCGLVRKKNVLSVMMQCLFLMGLMTVVWALWGYSLSFGGND